MDATRQSESHEKDNPMDWMNAMERLNGWALRLSRLQEEGLDEVRLQCLQAIAGVLACERGWLWVSEREDRTLGAVLGINPAQRETISVSQIDELWHGLESAESSETEWLLNGTCATAARTAATLSKNGWGKVGK